MICVVDGCEDGVRSKNATMCEKHYVRVRRNGHAGLKARGDYKRPDRKPRERDAARDQQMRELYESGQSTTEVGALIGLDASQVSRQLRQLGVTMRPRRRGRRQVVSYSGAHMRVRAVRGRAQEHTCECGKPAEQWAYTHSGPAELTSEVGAYSVDPSFYVPMCVPCHKRADLARIAGRA